MSAGRISAARIESLEFVPNTPLRERYYQLLDRGVLASDICRRLGWLHEDRADTRRLYRALGVKPFSDRRYPGGRGVQRFVTYELAVKLAVALEMDYHEAGV